MVATLPWSVGRVDVPRRASDAGTDTEVDSEASDDAEQTKASPIQPSLSLGTCGLKVTHAIGVCQFVYARYVHEAIRVVVTSGGCYPGVCLASGVEPFAWFEQDYASYCLGRWNSRSLGLFWDDHAALKRLFSRLPPCPKLVANRRLVVAVTPCPLGSNRWVACALIGALRALRLFTALVAFIFGVGDLSDRLGPLGALTSSDARENGVRLVDRWASMEDMLDYCMCSMHIPVLFHNPTPLMRRHLDGGFGGGDGAPTLDDFTITVQPDASAHVPRDAGVSWRDVLTLQSLRPQATVDVARRECAEGFEAARRRDALFLARGFALRDAAAADPAKARNPWAAFLRRPAH